MRLTMSEIDRTRAPAVPPLPPERLRNVIDTVSGMPGVEGCAILSSARRVEIYTDAAPSAEAPWRLLLQAAGGAAPETAVWTLRGEQAVRHMLEDAGGWSAPQLREAADGTGSALLEKLFRTAASIVERSLGFPADSREEAACSLIEEGVREVLCWQERRAGRGEAAYFPLFLDLRGRRVVLVGGGSVAGRRIGVLRQFGCDLTVIAPRLETAADWFTWLPRGYRKGDLAGAFLAIAATDSREVNHAVAEEAGRREIPVSVADRMEECSFLFPAICTGGGVTAGVVSCGESHKRTAAAAARIRQILDELP